MDIPRWPRTPRERFPITQPLTLSPALSLQASAIPHMKCTRGCGPQNPKTPQKLIVKSFFSYNKLQAMLFTELSKQLNEFFDTL